MGDYFADLLIEDLVIVELKAAKEIHEEVYCFLIKNNFEDQWNKILSNTKSERQLALLKNLWFKNSLQ